MPMTCKIFFRRESKKGSPSLMSWLSMPLNTTMQGTTFRRVKGSAMMLRKSNSAIWVQTPERG